MPRPSKRSTRTTRTTNATTTPAAATTTPAPPTPTPPNSSTTPPQAVQERPQAAVTPSTLPTQPTTPQTPQTPPAPVLDALTTLTPADIDRDPIAAALQIMAETATSYAQAKADLEQIKPHLLSKIIKLVCYLLEGDELPIARRKAGVSLIFLSYALDCKFFANIYTRTRRARRAEDVATIEAAQSALAAGHTAKSADFLPPDPTAAKLILQAHDPLYHPGQSSPVTAINIQVNGLPI